MPRPPVTEADNAELSSRHIAVGLAVAFTAKSLAGMVTVTVLLCGLLHASFTLTVTVMFCTASVWLYLVPAAMDWLTQVMVPLQSSVVAAMTADSRSGMAYWQLPAASAAGTVTSPIVGAVASFTKTALVLVLEQLCPSSTVKVIVKVWSQLLGAFAEISCVVADCVIVEGVIKNPSPPPSHVKV